MTHRKVPAFTAIISTLEALILVALAAIVSPALAATGADTRCDQSADSPQLPEAAVDSLTIVVVEYSASSHVTPGKLSVDGSADDGGSRLDPDPRPPEVDALLQRIFDASQRTAPGNPETHESDALSAPFAIQEPESPETPVTESADAEFDSVSPRLPGIFGDDLVRFKRQMYRTDI